MRTLPAFVFALCALTAFPGRAQRQTYYPTAHVAWKNLKTDYGAVGDGVTDDTPALRRAVRTLLNPYNNTVVVFVPRGTYLLRDSVWARQGYYDANLVLQGEDRDQTVLKVADNAPNFQDPARPRPVLYTRAGNQAFGNYLFNLTVNTGRGNPGAVALDYITSNYGALRDVRLVSPDGSGYCGLQMERAWPGPGLVKNVEVEGYQYGIRVATCEYSMTFENVTLRGQTVAGLANDCNTLAIRQLHSRNAVPALTNRGGRVTLLDSDLTGGAPAEYALRNGGGGFVFARNVATAGYGAALLDGAAPVASLAGEYRNLADYSLFPNAGRSLGLPVEETPDYVNNNPADWASAESFGAQPTNPLYRVFDATAAVQAAFNSGQKVIYFGGLGDNGTSYCIYADVTIPPSVELVTGLNLGKFTFFNNSRFVVSGAGGATPLFFERTKGLQIRNASARTVVLRHATGDDYDNTAANVGGKVFLEDWVAPFRPTYPVQLWARHLNPEVQPETERNLDNPGGKYWIMGLKTEGRAVVANTTRGGSTEVLGALVYPASSFSGTAQPAFTVENACFSVAGLTMTSYVSNGWYGVAVQETQGPTTRGLAAATVWGRTPYNFSFYASSPAGCATPLPVELTAFEAAPAGPRQVRLRWATAAETGHRAFRVERSATGEAADFAPVAALPGRGGPATYAHLDPVPGPGRYYYRLALLDADGRSTYSPTRAVLLGETPAGGAPALAPNPTAGPLQVQLPHPRFAYELRNALGAVLQTGRPAAALLELNLAAQPPGVYLLRLVDDDTQQAQVLKVVREGR